MPPHLGRKCPTFREIEKSQSNNEATEVVIVCGNSCPHGELLGEKKMQVWVFKEWVGKMFHGRLFRSATGISILSILIALITELRLHCQRLIGKEYNPHTE
jgi:hypothetical protein